jgi:hypothetical protein
MFIYIYIVYKFDESVNKMFHHNNNRILQGYEIIKN